MQPVSDPSLEKTHEEAGQNLYWDSIDGRNPNFGTVFYETDVAGQPGYAGDWSAWFGGWGGGDEEWQYFWQFVTLPPSGPLYLNYWQFVREVPENLTEMQVSVDDGVGAIVCSIDYDPGQQSADTGYVQRSLDISSCAGGEGVTRRIVFTYHHSGDGSDGSVFVDGVSVDRTPVSSVTGGGAPTLATHPSAPLTKARR